MNHFLLKFPDANLSPEELASVYETVAHGTVGHDWKVVHGFKAPETYAYLTLDAGPGNTGRGEDGALVQEIASAFRNRHPGIELVHLQPTLELAGSSSGNEARWHYVVETDVRAEAEDDFNTWYTTEHMPGLAAVPGTVRAGRYLASGRPRHYAAYDLETLETFGSPPWLAVRGTEWSSRVRPNFMNTKRTMFRIV